jgi:hypothetical protein
VAPIISARVSCVIFGISISGSPGLPNSAISRRILASGEQTLRTRTHSCSHFLQCPPLRGKGLFQIAHISKDTLGNSRDAFSGEGGILVKRFAASVLPLGLEGPLGPLIALVGIPSISPRSAAGSSTWPQASCSRGRVRQESRPAG